MDMMCIILCFYFVGGCILKWVLNREKTLFTTSSEHIITDTLPGDLIVHERTLNNKGNLSYSVKQLLRERTLHHRIYTLDPKTCINIRKLKIHKRKLRRKRGGKNKFKKHLGCQPANLINIKLNHKNEFRDVTENIKFATVNTQSIKPKTAVLFEYFNEQNIDLAVLAETWLKSEDELWIQGCDLNVSHNRIQSVCRTGTNKRVA